MAHAIFQYIKRVLRYVVKGIPRQVQNVVRADICYLAPGQRLQGKRIIITGGGRGLGLAMAEKFIAEGANVLITGRDEKILAEQSARLRCSYLALDVRNVQQFPVFLEAASEKLQGLDILVNNAGISLHEGNILQVSPEHFDAQMQTNLRGDYFLAKHFIESTLSCALFPLSPCW